LAKIFKRPPKLRTRTAARGWFYINPSRRGPVPGFWGLAGVPRLGGILGLEKEAPEGPPGTRVPETLRTGTGPRRGGLM